MTAAEALPDTFDAKTGPEHAFSDLMELSADASSTSHAACNLIADRKDLDHKPGSLKSTPRLEHWWSEISPSPLSPGDDHVQPAFIRVLSSFRLELSRLIALCGHLLRHFTLHGSKNRFNFKESRSFTSAGIIHRLSITFSRYRLWWQVACTQARASFAGSAHRSSIGPQHPKLLTTSPHLR